MFAGKPTGFDEIWVIGDTHFLARAKKSLDDLKDCQNFNRSDQALGKTMPYMLEQFEIFIGQCHYSWSFTTQIRGGLASLLSTKWKLPNYLYMVFSNDQVEDCDILDDLIYKVLEDLFKFINRALIDRKLELPRKARRSNPPRVIVVKTVAKAKNLLDRNNFKIRRRSFNRALQKISQNFNWRSINIDSIVPTIPQNFDENGDELSDVGMKLFWQFISEDLRALEAIDDNRKQ